MSARSVHIGCFTLTMLLAAFEAAGQGAQDSERYGAVRVSNQLEVTGAEVRRITGPDTALPASALPGIQFITERELYEMPDIPQTGLFIVGEEEIPPELPAELRQEGYVLQEDGRLLDEEGKPITMFVKSETYQVVPKSLMPEVINPRRLEPPEKDQPRQPGSPNEPTEGERRSQFSPQSDEPGSGSGSLLDLLVRPAHAAFPFPFACFSWSWKWKYDGGFCRDYKAWTDAYAWGPNSAGGCAGNKPQTKIQYLYGSAHVTGAVDTEHCYDCDQVHAFDEWDIGCFWVAHGKADGVHSAYWVDGAIQIYRSQSWIHD